MGDNGSIGSLGGDPNAPPRLPMRTSSGRRSASNAAAAIAAAATAGGVSGASAALSTLGTEAAAGGSGPTGRCPRPSGGSPAANTRNATRLRSTSAQVAQYLAMMEEDLQLDTASRTSSTGGPMANVVAGGGSSGAPPHHHQQPLVTLSNRSILSAGHSQGHLTVVTHAQMLQGAVSASRLSPGGSMLRHSPSAPRPSGSNNPINLRMTSSQSLSARLSGGGGIVAAAAAAVALHGARQGPSGSGSTTVVSTAALAGAAPSGAQSESNTGPVPAHHLTGMDGPTDVDEPGGPGGATAAAAASSVASPSGAAAAAAGTTSSASGMKERSEQGMIVLTGSGSSAVLAAKRGSSLGAPPVMQQRYPGGGSGAGVVGGGGLAAVGVSADGRIIRGGLINRHPLPGSPSALRGPNPTKSNSQPTMSVTGEARSMPNPAAASHASGSPGSGNSSGAGASATVGGGLDRSSSYISPFLRPNPMKSSSQPSMKVGFPVAAGGAAGRLGPGGGSTALGRTASHGSSRMMRNLGPAPVMPACGGSPTDSVHPMDLSPPVARIAKATSARRLAGPSLSPSAASVTPGTGTTGSITPVAEDEVAQRQRSVSTPTASHPSSAAGSALARRNRQPLEVAVPADGCYGGSGATPTANTAPQVPHLNIAGQPTGSGRDVNGNGVGSGGYASPTNVGGGGGGSGRQWVATVTSAAASPRTGEVGGAAGGAAHAVNDGSMLPSAHGHAAGPQILNRELHKVVKRLRPDGGSFTGSGSSPLGLPPMGPSHPGGGDSAGGAAAGGGGGGTGPGGSFSYSRRSSIDSHGLLYNSIASARSATAALQAGAVGGGAAGGGVTALHREKLLWGRGLLTAGGSPGGAASAAAGGGGGTGSGALHVTGGVPSGIFASDPNSPVSSYGPVAAGSSGPLVGRHGARALGGAASHMGGAMGASVASAAGSMTGPLAFQSSGGGGVGPRTTSCGASASRVSSGAEERTARQPSFVRRSSSVHSNTAASWGEYAAGALAGGGGPGGGGGGGMGGGVVAGGAGGRTSLSRATTGASLRILQGAGSGSVMAHGAYGAAAAAAAAGGGAAAAQAPTALVSPLLAHVTGAASQVSSSVAARMVSESAVSSTLGGWTGRDELPPQGEAAYALTGRAGTLMYMAPEVIRDEPYNEKVDVFSFGVVLYEVFGRVLLLEMYSKDELEALSSRIAQGYRHHRPECMPQTIWDVVQQCWAQNPADRPSMPLVVRQLELAMEAMMEAEAAAAAAAAAAHRQGSIFGELAAGGLGLGGGGGGGGGGSGMGSGPASPMIGGGGGGGGAGGLGSGVGAGLLGGKERGSGRSLTSHRSVGSSVRGISLRRRPSVQRSQPQPMAPTPGRQPPPPANQSVSDFATLTTALNTGTGSTGGMMPLQTTRGSVGGNPSLDTNAFEAAPEPRCAPCGCVIC
ncbi:hypothetical protein Agub_g2344 [Astrephomene gubernaculifera]|uniref:Serine-threonine/tyrosine-protein kinase catalytic domain-containing protein n=1 Tax=Astrephomene gubernaculifera TaxID=47775 RepID=A0AAD3DI35_9CHLO|nr:hypothetical protein Agub_g2344 [Astrephomene gubernaculifera]